MSLPSSDFILSNVRVYREIAEDAQRRGQASLEAHRSPKGDGSPGYVLVRDPDRVSFKNSMIAIVFAGMTIEAHLWLCGCALLGVARYKRIDRKPLEMRLAPLGVADATLFGDTKAFRVARAALVHEKAVSLSDDKSPVLVAQDEAAKALLLMTRILSATQSSAA